MTQSSILLVEANPAAEVQHASNVARFADRFRLAWARKEVSDGRDSTHRRRRYDFRTEYFARLVLESSCVSAEQRGLQ